MALAPIREADTYTSVRGNSSDNPTLLTDGRSAISMETHRDRNQDCVSTKQTTGPLHQEHVGHCPRGARIPTPLVGAQTPGMAQDSSHRDLLGGTT